MSGRVIQRTGDWIPASFDVLVACNSHPGEAGSRSQNHLTVNTGLPWRYCEFGFRPLQKRGREQLSEPSEIFEFPVHIKVRFIHYAVAIKCVKALCLRQRSFKDTSWLKKTAKRFLAFLLLKDANRRLSFQ